MGEGPTRETIGLTAEEMMAYLEEVLAAEAAEAAEQRGTNVQEELASPGFASARAASTYAIKLIEANNAFIARYLLDQGILQPSPIASNEQPPSAAEPDEPGR